MIFQLEKKNMKVVSNMRFFLYQRIFPVQQRHISCLLAQYADTINHTIIFTSAFIIGIHYDKSESA